MLMSSFAYLGAGPDRVCAPAESSSNLYKFFRALKTHGVFFYVRLVGQDNQNVSSEIGVLWFWRAGFFDFLIL